MIVEKLTVAKDLISGLCVSGHLGIKEPLRLNCGELLASNSSSKRIAVLEVCKAIDSAAADLKSETYGLQFSRDVNPSVLGMAGQAMFHSNTIYRALQVYRNYISLLIEHVDVDFCEVGSVYELTLTYPPLTNDWNQFLDFDAGLAVRMLRKCLGGDWTPAYVSLQRNRPLNTAAHESIFGQRITYASQKTVIAITKESKPRNLEPDRTVFDLIENQCALELRKLRNSLPLKNRVEIELLRRIPQGDISIASISTHFSMSIRNFQRRLAIESTSFEFLIESTRKELSSHFLKDESIAISRIADLLGYSSPNAYSRAAKQWYRVPPSEQRVAFKH
jgi:AraC-like DNA-binding protein